MAVSRRRRSEFIDSEALQGDTSESESEVDSRNDQVNATKLPSNSGIFEKTVSNLYTHTLAQSASPNLVSDVTVALSSPISGWGVPGMTGATPPAAFDSELPIWRIECRVGIEKHAVEYLDKALKSEDRLFSAHFFPSIPGWIYVQLQPFGRLNRRLRSTPGLLVRRDINLQHVPDQDKKALSRLGLLSFIDISDWGFIIRGPYKGALGVARNILAGGGLQVLILPRVITTYNQGKDGSFTPVRLFNPKYHYPGMPVAVPIDAGDNKYSCGDHEYDHGLQVVALPTSRHFMTVSLSISVSDLLRFNESDHPVLLSRRFPRVREWEFRIGENVTSYGRFGQKKGSGRVSAIGDWGVEIELLEQGDTIFSQWVDVRKSFNDGDYVRETWGTVLTRRSGFVLKVDGAAVELCDFGRNQAQPFRVHINSVTQTTAPYRLHETRLGRSDYTGSFRVGDQVVFLLRNFTPTEPDEKEIEVEGWVSRLEGLFIHLSGWPPKERDNDVAHSAREKPTIVDSRLVIKYQIRIPFGTKESTTKDVINGHDRDLSSLKSSLNRSGGEQQLARLGRQSFQLTKSLPPWTGIQVRIIKRKSVWKDRFATVQDVWPFQDTRSGLKIFIGLDSFGGQSCPNEILAFDLDEVLESKYNQPLHEQYPPSLDQPEFWPKESFYVSALDENIFVSSEPCSSEKTPLQSRTFYDDDDGQPAWDPSSRTPGREDSWEGDDIDCTAPSWIEESWAFGKTLTVIYSGLTGTHGGGFVDRRPLDVEVGHHPITAKLTLLYKARFSYNAVLPQARWAKPLPPEMPYRTKELLLVISGPHAGEYVRRYGFVPENPDVMLVVAMTRANGLECVAGQSFEVTASMVCVCPQTLRERKWGDKMVTGMRMAFITSQRRLSEYRFL